MKKRILAGAAASLLSRLGQLKHCNNHNLYRMLFQGERLMRELKRIYNDGLMFYAEPGTSEPAPIKDKEMEMFILVCRTPVEYLKFFDEDFLAKCKVGQKVRVTGGLYKGAEGYIKRIKKDRRLLVRIEGVAVVATGFIPPSQLEPVDE